MSHGRVLTLSQHRSNIAIVLSLLIQYKNANMSNVMSNDSWSRILKYFYF